MGDLAYVTRTTAHRDDSATCPRCRPPMLCTAHVVALTAARREREAELLRSR